eukprot:scaffold43790_cov38-Cyclotella_meneghiniana.AAC.7
MRRQTDQVSFLSETVLEVTDRPVGPSAGLLLVSSSDPQWRSEKGHQLQVTLSTRSRGVRVVDGNRLYQSCGASLQIPHDNESERCNH